MDYSSYRGYVLAKTTGANIHRINGLLGNVMNGLACLRYRRANGGEIEDVQNRLESALGDIEEATGVPAFWLDVK